MFSAVFNLGSREEIFLQQEIRAGEVLHVVNDHMMIVWMENLR